MDLDKVSSVLNWPTPQNLKEVRGFLGLTGYYRCFIRDYGKMAQPITTLLKKEQGGEFCWSNNAQATFQCLQSAMTLASVLTTPDFTQPLVIECDTSGIGIGVVLMQENNPIAFFSKSLAERWWGKSAYEKELMALAMAIQHW